MKLMTDQIKDAVLRALVEVVPEANLATLDPRVSFREQLDMDSFDFLNFVIGIHQELGVAIPETDYPKLATLDSCVSYVTAVNTSGATLGEAAKV